MRLADYVIQKLQEEGCEHIFTVTGRGILYLTDALARHQHIKGISVHHEQSASYAAMAYSQANDHIGAALVSSGCASTNATTGVLCAWQDNIPCVFISGQNKLKETVRHTRLPIRTFGQQEADIVSIMEPITKYATMITSAEDIVFELEKALYLAQNGRKGPVWIDIPLDIQNMRIDPDSSRHYLPDLTSPASSDENLDYVLTALHSSERPIILIGSGIRSAKAVDHINSFLEKSRIPAVYASSATDILDSEKVLSIGCVGAMATNRAANFAIQNSDLLLILGCRLTTMVTGADPNKFARSARIIAIDIDEYEHQKFHNKIDKIIISDVKIFIETLSTENIRDVSNHWIEKCKHWKSIFPKCEGTYHQEEPVDLYYLAAHLTKCLDDNACCISDAGLEELIIPTTVEFSIKQRCIHPASQGAMGYALPAAIGAFYANNNQTVAVIGDGSIMMNIQELQTIRHNNLPIKILVINNNCYAVIRSRQKDLFRTRTIGTDKSNGVSCPDFQKVADCYGIHYEKIISTSELNEKLADILALDHSVICEIMAKETQPYIHSSHRRSISGRYVQPPIEDQSPFLDRDLFLSEMIIDTIDQ